MTSVITTMRFLEYGKPAPKNSGFKGMITGDTVFGRRGWMSYTSRSDAVNPSGATPEPGDGGSFLGYSGREAAEYGYTMSSFGFLDTEEKRDFFREACHNSFNKNGDLIWDVVISLKDYEEAKKCGLNDQENYGAFINVALVDFFKRIDMDPTNVLWWEDYHCNTEHPHMHVCFLEKNHTRDRGRFTAKELRKLKYCVAKELTVREQRQGEISDFYANPFREKDAERAEVLQILRRTDFGTIDGIESLANALPRSGRLQYGSYQIAPFRNAIDKITDSILNSDALKDSYHTYLKSLDQMEKAIDERAGTHVATIKETELKKLHSEIGNIILRYVKEIRMSNKDTRSGYKYLAAEMEKTENQNDEHMKNTSLDWNKYKEIRGNYYNALYHSSTAVRKELVHTVLEDMKTLLEKTDDNTIRQLLSQRLALSYLYGKGTEKDLPAAEKYSLEAVKAGSTLAYTILAKSYFAQEKDGEGMNALLEGKQKGDPAAAYTYGLQLISGNHCSKDRETGFEMVMNAAEHGCLPALNYLQTHKGTVYHEATQKAAAVKAGHAIRMSRPNVGGEVASFINNSSQLHTYNGQIEREIDAYLNDKNRVVQKSF